MKTIAANGLNFVVEEKGSGPVVVLLHGFPLSSAMWRAQIDALAAFGFRVVAPNLRGFGGSDFGAGDATMDLLADDVAAILDAMGVSEPVVLAGFSMGGYAAFSFWRRHAKRVRALAFVDTHHLPDTPEAAEGRHKTAAKVLAEGAKVIADAMTPKLFAPDTFKKNAAVIEPVRKVMLDAPPQAIANALRGMASRADSTPTLATITVPTIAILGERDELATPEKMLALVEGVKGARLAAIADAGHMAPVENPEEVTSELLEFLRGLK